MRLLASASSHSFAYEVIADVGIIPVWFLRRGVPLVDIPGVWEQKAFAGIVVLNWMFPKRESGTGPSSGRG